MQDAKLFNGNKINRIKHFINTSEKKPILVSAAVITVVVLMGGLITSNTNQPKKIDQDNQSVVEKVKAVKDSISPTVTIKLTNTPSPTIRIFKVTPTLTSVSPTITTAPTSLPTAIPTSSPPSTPTLIPTITLTPTSNPSPTSTSSATLTPTT